MGGNPVKISFSFHLDDSKWEATPAIEKRLHKIDNFKTNVSILKIVIPKDVAPKKAQCFSYGNKEDLSNDEHNDVISENFRNGIARKIISDRGKEECFILSWDKPYKDFYTKSNKTKISI